MDGLLNISRDAPFAINVIFRPVLLETRDRFSFEQLVQKP